MSRRHIPPEFEKDADPFIVVGIDGEWVVKCVGNNRMLSYQFAVLNADTDKMVTYIHYPKKNGKRISLEYGLSRALLKARQHGVIDQVPKRIVLAGHFTRADLTTFSDFNDIKRRLGAVRKTYVSTKIPLQVRLAASEGMVRCNATVIDTMLLSSAGTSLDAIGKLLGIPKIELPEGHSKDRMDLFLTDHPKLFEKYALTDAVIAAKWVARIYRMLLDRFGIGKRVITLGGAAVELVKRQAKIKDIELNGFLGLVKPKQPMAHLASLIAIAAQSYHGGYNIATALGLSPEGRELFDLDIKAAYTSALAFIRVPDWASARHCTALRELAVIEEAMTGALVQFRFPDGTLFPCLPVRASNGRGLVYPLEGSSWCTGPELVVALAAGAVIEVKDGYRVDWIANSIRLFEDITRLIGEIRAEAKTMTPPDMVLDKTAKEIGNSIYGKIAQAVAGTRVIKDDIEQRRVFNTKFDQSDQLGPSAITSPMMAAYCTGLVRALLLETTMRLPPGSWIGTATTDGILSTCSLDDIDQSGPLAMAFLAARGRITPGDNTIWEVKHIVPGALVTKTRGTYTVADESFEGSAVLAKAGYMAPEQVRTLSEIAQCQEWIKLYRERTYQTTMQSKSLTSLRQQHIFNEDLQAINRDIRWNADYDMKRKLVQVRNVDGLITADTVPWRSIDEFEAARNQLDDWKRSQRRVLKTRQDYDDMQAWGAASASRRRIGMRAHNKLSPMAGAVLKVLAHRNEPFCEWFALESNSHKAQFMSALCGVNITKTDLKNAKRRGAKGDDLTGSITEFDDDDRTFLMSWFGFRSIAPAVSEIAYQLCAEGSEAAEELGDLLFYATDPRRFEASAEVDLSAPAAGCLLGQDTLITSARL